MTRIVKLACLVLMVLMGSKKSDCQTDESGKTERLDIKNEVIEMRNRLALFLDDADTSGQLTKAKLEFNNKLNHLKDSVGNLLKQQQQEIEELKIRLKTLEDAKPATAEVVSVKFDNILEVLYFDVGSFALSDENKVKIKKLVQQHGNKILQLVSYTDWVGNDEYNRQLSNQRALAVQKELTGEGVQLQKIKIYARGKMADENEKLSAKECRRVEIRY
ncbi:MAG: OmpA family protein [Bacteroidota bacterium]|nr:OmpA family protein [Bacteroidota bacterium]